MTDVEPRFKQAKPAKKPRKPLQARKPGRSWWQVRKWVASRAGELCEANTPGCPDYPHRGEQAHHITRRAQGGPDEPGNLLWVCARGHGWIHDHPALSRERGWLH